MDCPAALERIKEGRPITIKDDNQNINKCIADTVSVSIIGFKKIIGFFKIYQFKIFVKIKVVDQN